MRMRVVTAVALALLALGLAGWVRGYLPENWTLRAYRGSLVLVFYDAERAIYIDPANNPYDPSTGTPFPRRWGTETILADFRSWATLGWLPVEKPLYVRLAGFELAANTRGRLSGGYFVVAAPFWALCLPPAAAAAWGLWKARRERAWRRTGRCARCGYDLRATAATCPECGTSRQMVGATAG